MLMTVKKKFFFLVFSIIFNIFLDANSLSQSDVDQILLYDDNDTGGLTADGFRISMDYSNMNGLQSSVFGFENSNREKNSIRYEHRGSLPHVGE